MEHSFVLGYLCFLITEIANFPPRTAFLTLCKATPLNLSPWSHPQMPRYLVNTVNTMFGFVPEAEDESPRRHQSAYSSGVLSENNGLVGLRNIGNTCFMNSVTQCLSNTRCLLEYLVRDGYSSDINTTTSTMKGDLVRAFANLLSDMWNEGGDSSRALNTGPFKSQIQRFAPAFSGYQQHDAQEFLRKLLEGLHEDVNRVTVKPKPITEDIDDDLHQKAMESWKRYLRYDDSKVVDMFVGQLKSCLQCSVCGHCSVTFDPFWDLSLPIPSKSGQVRLSQCLDLFTKEEVLDGDERPVSRVAWLAAEGNKCLLQKP
ncbi:Ubiquitin carboxyl-terminal hydrolase 2 [Portunus trituberculatus]|uniref:ubiquitinyl hydrolase 1 n=1 Tax=Portunus trituberculatus TaxID=210409 RepID=A0A5B7CKB3_PORTR|nr:Ubiquitin carboxyl-terminal hydrolase 2 [Portunus trituberculatus]